jgi:hypothetical protein
VEGSTYYARQSRTARLAAMGMLLYAADHTNNFPITFDQAASYYASETNLNAFEIIYRDPLTNIAIPSNAIIVQSIHPWVTVKTLAKAYGFADGHSEIREIGKFDDWEQDHVPVQKNP